MRTYLTLLLFIGLMGCQSEKRETSTEVAVATIEQADYELFPIAGSETLRAVRRDATGKLLEAGFLRNNVKQGTWVTYTQGGKEQEAPEKIVSYIDGALNGPYIEMDEQGRIALSAHYKANVLNGPYAKYRIGRPEQTVNYVDGQMDGPLIEYDFRNQKIKQEVTYRMGVLHGPFRYFNEEGEVMQEYNYVDGERQ